MNVKCGSDLVEDSVFELGAETLGQIPWIIRDPEST